mmetsp:Transcript_56919/g.92120  ORF Transcript_56919/g.92120 Transcript_56919/m.92120 type:complete len:81 (+) Transcript_56919:67-309(+)
MMFANFRRAVETRRFTLLGAISTSSESSLMPRDLEDCQEASGVWQGWADGFKIDDVRKEKCENYRDQRDFNLMLRDGLTG